MNPVVKALDRVGLMQGDRTGRVNPKHLAHHSVPWNERTQDAVYRALDGTVWMYRLLNNSPLRIANESELLSYADDVMQVFSELGRTSIPAPGKLSNPPSSDFYRSVHVVTLRWYEQPKVPKKTNTQVLRDYLEREVLRYRAPRQLVFVGVQLRDFSGGKTGQPTGFFDFAKDFIEDILGESTTQWDRFERDRDFVHTLLSRHNCRVPTYEEVQHLQAWFRGGGSPEVEVIPYPEYLLVDRQRRLSFYALENYSQPQRPPGTEWVSDALDHPGGPTAISVRGQLKPGVDVKKSLKKSVRKRDEQARDREETTHRQDAEEITEDQMALAAADVYSGKHAEPVLSNTSVLFGVFEEDGPDGSTEPFADMIRNQHGIELRPLVHQQTLALNEVQPGSQVRTNAFPRTLPLQVIKHSGIGIFTELGDDYGAHVGKTLPDGGPTYWEAIAPSRDNQAPATAIFGDPGSGKTMLMLHMLYQAAIAGYPVSMVNPKGGDSLSYFLRFLEAQGVPTEWTPLSKLTSAGARGTYDPFRYLDWKGNPDIVSMVVSQFVNEMLPEFSQEQRNNLRRGIHRGAAAGAECSIDAIRYVTDKSVRDQVLGLWEANPVVGMIFADEPKPPLREHVDEQGRGKFLLTEFDMALPIPTSMQGEMTDDERIALVVIRAITAANIGMLSGLEGGVYAIDEAHVVLGHSRTVDMIQRIMREGRSMNVSQLYATQLPSDLLQVAYAGGSLETFLTRTFALHLKDKKQADAALQLLGYEEGSELIPEVQRLKSKRAPDGSVAQAARAFMRDLKGRKGMVSLEPMGQSFFAHASTNVDDRKAQAKLNGAGSEDESAAAVGS